MERIGIDLGASKSHVVVMSPTGEIRLRRTVSTEELPAWLACRERSRVVMEACTQSRAIGHAALAAHHEAVIVPGQMVRALGVGARGIKTDERDAEVLALASVRNDELVSVHLPSEKSCDRRELLMARRSLLESRSRIALSLKSWLRGRLIRLRGRASSRAFSALVRKTALAHPDGLPLGIETMLSTYEHLCDQVELLDAELVSIAESDPICTQLMTVPGVGPVVAMAYSAQVDDPHRFRSSDELSSYLALVPGEATTGGKIVRTSTIKAGPTHLKALLVQSAWSLWRSRPCEPVVLWARAIAEKRGRRIAIMALARKLATVMWAMWKHQTSYDPLRASSMRPAA